MHVMKDVRIGKDKTLAYEIGAMVNGVWFMHDILGDKGDAMQAVNYLNGGEKMPDLIKSKFCLLVIPEDAPPRFLGPVRKRETRDNLARIQMLEMPEKTLFYAVTWERDHYPQIRRFHPDEVQLRSSMFLGKIWINDGETIYSDKWLFWSAKDDSDESYISSLKVRYNTFTPDEHQDNTWNSDDGRIIEEDGYSLIPLHHEHIINEYIR